MNNEHIETIRFKFNLSFTNKYKIGIFIGRTVFGLFYNKFKLLKLLPKDLKVFLSVEYSTKGEYYFCIHRKIWKFYIPIWSVTIKDNCEFKELINKFGEIEFSYCINDFKFGTLKEFIADGSLLKFKKDTFPIK